MLKVVLFEDGSARNEQLLAALSQALGPLGTAVAFRPTAREDQCMHQEQLRKDLVDAGLRDASLIVADRDLSQWKEYPGLSEPVVRQVADEFSIPECYYARGESATYDRLVSSEVREGRIAVSAEGGDGAFAKRVVAIARGFDDILKRIPESVAGRSRQRSFGPMVASLLGKPQYAEKVSLYSSGDRDRLAQVLRVGPKAAGSRTLACTLGYWLWDSVLRFPGVVVNAVAAASYLNIRSSDFNQVDVLPLLDHARYRGPFADAIGPLWWRGELDDTVAQSGAADGREFAGAVLGRELTRSECCEDPTIPAGYYCMFRGEPVSLANSKPGLAWFPRGADLARISNSKYEEDVPWL